MQQEPQSALDRARQKAYRRLIPLVFVAYVIAYVDRANVAVAGIPMAKDLGFDNVVFGTGSGIFFIGYFLLEIPGSLLVERWSARKWISRIMLTWGIMAAATAFVTTPMQFYGVRFLLGLAEAGFFPGVIVYLTHWFPSRDRARALSYFFVAAPLAQIISPKISNLFLHIGTEEMVNGVLVRHPEFLGLTGWQWVYIVWGLPAVILAGVVLFGMTDRPSQAKWLSNEEREALEAELAREKAAGLGQAHGSVMAALLNPKVLLLALAQFFAVTGNYGVEFFLPKILQRWYGLSLDALTWYIIIPYVGLLIGILVIGWNSDRTRERWLHAAVPLYIGAGALVLAAFVRNSLPITLLLFSLTFFFIRGYLGAFWSLPNLFLKGAAAAGSIGLINSVANLGGFLGPRVIGGVEKATGSFEGGLYFLAGCTFLSGTILFALGRWHRRSTAAEAVVATSASPAA